MINTGSKGFIGGTPATANPYSGGGSQNAARALGSIGKSLSQLGAEGLAIAQELQSEKNSFTISTIKNEWMEGRDKLNAALMEEHDPDKRVTMARESMMGIKDKSFQRDYLPPVVKKKLEEDWGRFSTQYIGSITTQSASLMIEQSRAQSGMLVDRAVRNLKKEDLIDAVNDLNGSPVKKQRILEKGLRDIQLGEIELLANEDPFAAEKAMNTAGLDLSPLEKSRMKKGLKRAQSGVRRSAVEAVTSEAAVKGVRTEEDFLSLMDKQPHLDKNLREEVLHNWRQSQPLDLDTKSDLTDRINDLTEAREAGEVDPAIYEMLHDDLAQEVFALGPRQGSGPLRKMIYDRDPAHWKGENLQQGRADNNLKTVQSWAKLYEAKGAFGSDENGDEEISGGEALTARRRKDRLISSMDKWIRANPEATEEEMEAVFRKRAVKEITGDLFKSEETPRSDRLDDLLGTEGNKKTTSLPKLQNTGNFKVFNGSRDQMKGFSSTSQSRKIALDFNDADNKSARGIEIVLPKDHTAQELEAAKQWAKHTHAFFESKGIEIPIRQEGTGVKIGGGKKGVIHTEPFFASNSKARQAIMRDPVGYAKVLGGTLGKLQGMTFIAPHTRDGATNDSNPGTGATSGSFSERSFALNVIIPALLKLNS